MNTLSKASAARFCGEQINYIELCSLILCFVFCFRFYQFFYHVTLTCLLSFIIDKLGNKSSKVKDKSFDYHDSRCDGGLKGANNRRDKRLYIGLTMGKKIIAIIAFLMVSYYLLNIFLVGTCLHAKDLELLGSIPYDTTIFTQGLVYNEGNLYISSGLYGYSALYKYDLKKRVVEQIHKCENDFFAEGITVVDGKIVGVSWKKEKGYVFDLSKLSITQEFSYSGEGWGLTGDSFRNLFLSNGTGLIKVLKKNGNSLIVLDQVEVQGGEERLLLNELEMVRGKILANVWRKDVILIIDIPSGEILKKLYPKKYIDEDELKYAGVLNGIAWDKKNNHLYVTGKNWPKIYLFSLK